MSEAEKDLHPGDILNDVIHRVIRSLPLPKEIVSNGARAVCSFGFFEWFFEEEVRHSNPFFLDMDAEDVLNGYHFDYNGVRFEVHPSGDRWCGICLDNVE